MNSANDTQSKYDICTLHSLCLQFINGLKYLTITQIHNYLNIYRC